MATVKVVAEGVVRSGQIWGPLLSKSCQLWVMNWLWAEGKTKVSSTLFKSEFPVHVSVSGGLIL